MDGDFLPDLPQKLVQQGRIADVPFVNGVSEMVRSCGLDPDKHSRIARMKGRYSHSQPSISRMFTAYGVIEMTPY